MTNDCITTGNGDEISFYKIRNSRYLCLSLHSVMFLDYREMNEYAFIQDLLSGKKNYKCNVSKVVKEICLVMMKM